MPLFVQILLAILIALLIINLLFLSWYYGKKRSNARAPENGINESLYIDVNGTKQWINIYGKDLNNPVLLYLHGGPGMSTSTFSYAITRKWADAYTVVTWDQRNCGKSYCQKMDSLKLDKNIVMDDAMAVAEYVSDRMKKDRITLLGHS